MHTSSTNFNSKLSLMKNCLPLFLGSLVFGVSTQSFAQTRYLEEVFDEVNIQQNVAFGFNVDALRSNFTDLAGYQADYNVVNDLIVAGENVPLNYFQSNGALPAEDHTTLKLFPLNMDIYTPAGDVETDRPLIIYLHTGNFLPPIINKGITGSKADSALVNHCKKWAKTGYTVAAINYRTGWNPVSEDPDVRRGTLLKAVYRAIHDTQTAVRFFRATTAQGNPFGINGEDVILFGQGSGGYVAQAYATLNDYNTEIAGLDKFIGDNGLPYVLEGIDGSIDGGPGFLRVTDPLQVAGLDRSISMAINAGGALADISWLDAGEPPMVSIHAIRDPFAPFDDGTVVVPTTNENVVDVSGSNVFIQLANDLGNNNAFKNMPGNDPYTQRARSLYGETFEYILASQPTITVNESPEGLFPVLVPINTINGNRFTNESGPWDWWDYNTLVAVVAGTNAALGLSGDDAYNADVYHGQGMAGNPGMGQVKGMAYIDTIQGYTNPRIMCVLGIEGVDCGLVSTNNTIQDNSTVIFPNPTRDALTIRNNDFVIREVRMYDITGRMVGGTIVNAKEYRLERGSLNNGVYMMQITFDNQTITRKVLFN